MHYGNKTNRYDNNGGCEARYMNIFYDRLIERRAVLYNIVLNLKDKIK